MVRTIPAPRPQKLTAPRVGSRLGHRVRWLDGPDRLDRGEQARLTLVLGSPGAGKTVLLADWLASHPERTSTWLGCDAADAEPVRGAAAVVDATRRAAAQPNLGEDARQWLSVDRRVSADVVARGVVASRLEPPMRTSETPIEVPAGRFVVGGGARTVPPGVRGQADP